MKEESIPDLITHCLNEMLPNLTKDEADMIEEVLKWNDMKRSAFMMAKRIFEEREDG